jgi:RNA polymerase sigma-70 factor (ECF subfamily)
MNRVNGGRQHETDGGSGWDQWLAQHAPKLLLFARQQARCEADAQELVQDAVVEAWRQQTDGLPPAPGLVFGLIRRRAIDLARSHDRRVNRETTAQDAASPEWFAPEIEDRERARLLQTALNQLPETQRDVVTLKIWGDLTFAEIAEALEIPANTAASRYRYALEELRKLTKEIFV